MSKINTVEMFEDHLSQSNYFNSNIVERVKFVREVLAKLDDDDKVKCFDMFVEKENSQQPMSAMSFNVVARDIPLEDRRPRVDAFVVVRALDAFTKFGRFEADEGAVMTKGYAQGVDGVLIVQSENQIALLCADDERGGWGRVILFDKDSNQIKIDDEEYGRFWKVGSEEILKNFSSGELEKIATAMKSSLAVLGDKVPWLKLDKFESEIKKIVSYASTCSKLPVVQARVSRL